MGIRSIKKILAKPGPYGRTVRTVCGLPVLGPSTVRDALSKTRGLLANPIGYVTNVPLRNSLQGYKMLDTRTNLLEASDGRSVRAGSVRDGARRGATAFGANQDEGWRLQ